MAVFPNATPSDLKDFAIRVFKAFLAGAFSGTTIAAFTKVSALQGMAFAGATAAYSVILNAILKFANSRAGGT